MPNISEVAAVLRAYNAVRADLAMTLEILRVIRADIEHAESHAARVRLMELADECIRTIEGDP